MINDYKIFYKGFQRNSIRDLSREVPEGGGCHTVGSQKSADPTSRDSKLDWIGFNFIVIVQRTMDRDNEMELEIQPK